MLWYRNRRGLYHAARPDYIATGRALCSANIARPAFVGSEYDTTGMLRFSSYLQCRKCRKIRDKKSER